MTRWRPGRHRREDGRRPLTTMEAALAPGADPLAVMHHQLLHSGCDGGEYFGAWTAAGDPIQVPARGCTLTIAAPGAGKSRGQMAPAIMCHPGPVLSTSLKPDLFSAAWRARARVGRVLIFDPGGLGLAAAADHERVCELRWSPVWGAEDWDSAMLTARLMIGAGSAQENHWDKKARQLLGALLHAAGSEDLGMQDVLAWVLASDFESPAAYLPAGSTAAAMLGALEDTPDNERGSIMSTLSAAIEAYASDAAMRSASEPASGENAVKLDAGAWVSSRADSIFIVAPRKLQELLAPPIVGLLNTVQEAIEHLSVQLHVAGLGERRIPPVLFALDEIANIAPIPDLVGLMSTSGGLGLQIHAALQSWHQALVKWPGVAADLRSFALGRMVGAGVQDERLLELVSKLFGDYDARVESGSSGQSSGTAAPARGLLAHSRNSGETHSTSWSTRRQRILTVADLAKLEVGQALISIGARAEIVTMPWWDQHPVLSAIAAGGPELCVPWAQGDAAEALIAEAA